MLGRGENIGTAYVRIIADGSNLGQSIRDEFDKSDPAFHAAGQRQAQAYFEAFDKETDMRLRRRELRDSIQSAMAKNDFLNDEFFEGNNWTEFRNSMRARFGEVGVVAARNLEQSMIEGMTFDEMRGRMQNLNRELAKEQQKKHLDEMLGLSEDHERDFQKMLDYYRDYDEAHREKDRRAHEAYLKDLADLDKDYELDQQRTREHIEALEENRRRDEQAWWKVQEDHNRDFELQMRRTAEHAEALLMNEQRNAKARRESQDSLRRLTNEYREYVVQMRMVERGDRDARMNRRELMRGFDELRESVHRLGLETDDIDHDFNRMSRSTARLTPGLSRLNRDLDVTRDRIGTMFGRGSRNNFLNFFGSTIRNALGLVTGLFKITGSVLSYGRGLIDIFGTDGMGGVLTQLGKTAGAAALGLAAIGIAAAVVITILGPLVALISGLVGILAALAGTVVMAVIGSLAALAGAFLPVVAGIGVMVTGFLNLEGKAKKSLDQIGDAFRGLGEAAADGLTFDRTPFDDLHDHSIRTFSEMMTAIAGMVRQLRPIVEDIGRAAADSIDIFIDTMTKGRGAWDKFINAMNRDRDGNGLGWLADQVRIMGRVFSNVFGGMLGLFRGMMPLVSDFTGWLRDITGEFEKWANSAEGQRDIKDFLSDAADSARSLGGFLSEAFGFLMDLIRTGNKQGDSMFDGMTRSLSEFRDHIMEPITMPVPVMGGRMDPEGLLPDPGQATTRMESWFTFAERLGRKLGELAVAAGKIFDDLDTEQSRTELLGVLEVLEDILGVMQDIVGLYEFLKNFSIPGLLENGREILEMGSEGPDGVSGTGSGMGKPGWSAAGNDYLEAFTAELNAETILKAIGNVDISNLITGQDRAIVSLLTPFDGKGKAVRDEIGETDVADLIDGQSNALVSLITPFNGSGSKVRKNIGQVDVKDMISNVLQALASLVNPFNPSGQQVRGAIGQVDVSGIISGADAAAQNLVDRFRGLNSVIEGAIGTIVPIFDIRMPSIPGVKRDAAGEWYGDITRGPALRLVGEEGPEAIVPLNRPLSQVDPAVRWLSAIAQGKGMAAGGVVGGGKTVNVGGVTVVSPSADPRAVASEMLNHLAAVAY
jgi:hypothetical protein